MSVCACVCLSVRHKPTFISITLYNGFLLMLCYKEIRVSPERRVYFLPPKLCILRKISPRPVNRRKCRQQSTDASLSHCDRPPSFLYSVVHRRQLIFLYFVHMTQVLRDGIMAGDQ